MGVSGSDSLRLTSCWWQLAEVGFFPDIPRNMSSAPTCWLNMTSYLQASYNADYIHERARCSSLWFWSRVVVVELWLLRHLFVLPNVSLSCRVSDTPPFIGCRLAYGSWCCVGCDAYVQLLQPKALAVLAEVQCALKPRRSAPGSLGSAVLATPAIPSRSSFPAGYSRARPSSPRARTQLE